MKLSLSRAVLLTTCFPLLVACGRPATEQECQEILRRSAELELREQLGEDEELIESEIKAIESSMQEVMMEKCVGKRITESALVCIRQAKTSEELFEECFR